MNTYFSQYWSHESICKVYGEMCRRPSSKDSKRGGPSSDEVMTGLNHNLITQRFKLNNKVALITGAATASPTVLSAPSV